MGTTKVRQRPPPGKAKTVALTTVAHAITIHRHTTTATLEDAATAAAGVVRTRLLEAQRLVSVKEAIVVVIAAKDVVVAMEMKMVLKYF